MIVAVGRAPPTASVGTLGVPFVPTPLVGANSFKVTCAPFDPPANSLLLAIALNRSTALMGAQSISHNAGGALTWVLRNDKLFDVGIGQRARQRVFCALIGASPPTGLTITSTSTLARSSLATVCLTGPTTIPTNFDADDDLAKDDAGNVTSTFPSPPAAGSTILTFLSGSVADGIDTLLPFPGAYTELDDSRDPDGQILVQTCYLAGGGTTAVSWNNPAPYSGRTIGSIIEIPLPS